MTWSDPAEKDAAAKNIQRIDANRLLAITEEQKKIHAFIQDFGIKHNAAPELKSVRAFAQVDPKLDQLAVAIATEGQFYRDADFDELLEREVRSQTALHFQRIAQESAQMLTRDGKTPDEAVGHLFASIKVPSDKGKGAIPASMKAAARALIAEYDRRQNCPQHSLGIPSGYGLFDKSTMGIKKKQLYLHAGFPGHLKSTMILNQMVNAAVDYGWNVLLFTTEMPATDVQLMLVSIHSAHKRFNGVNSPLNAYRLLHGKLTPKEKKFFEDVLDDLVHNPEHGLLRVVDNSEFTTLGSIIQRTTQEHQKDQVDQVWIDYLTRLPVDHRYSRLLHNEARNETITEAKRFAMTFDGNKGLAVCSAFQMNREGFKKNNDKQQKGKHAANQDSYDLTNLSQYNAAEREADVITYSWFGDIERKASEVKVGLLKSRWGEVPSGGANMLVDKDSRRIHDTTAATSPAAIGMQVSDEVVL